MPPRKSSRLISSVQRLYDEQITRASVKSTQSFSDLQRWWIFVVNIVLPPPIFTGVLWAIDSEIRYTHPHFLYLFIGTLGFLFISLGLFTLLFSGRRYASVVFLYTAAFGFAIAIGELNYKYHFQPVFSITALRERANVDPTQTPGAAVADSGRVFFTPQTRVDVNRGMSYTTLDTYCVAPITVGDAQQESYDFWAIGMNCCSSVDPSFVHCGNMADAKKGTGVFGKANAGLRLMFPEQTKFFRLAVEQAEAEYDIRAGENPLFFYWVDDPVGEILEYKRKGFEAKIGWSFTHVSANAAVAIIMLVFGL